MKSYFYYPGCSLEATASEYDVSTRALFNAMGIELIELEDWTCCGATAADAVSRLLALVLPARNLALAENAEQSYDLLSPCSACYLNLKKAAEEIQHCSETKAAVNAVLALEQLAVSGRIKVRHLLDVLANDIDLGQLTAKVCRPLHDLVVAPYYGCQCLRPYPVFDDPEMPTSMEPLLSAAGARIHPWHMGAKCCGASHMNTKMDVGLALSGAILAAAQGADLIVTVCPMCQMNLEAYQKKISKGYGRDLSIPIVYLPQLLGIAIGLEADAVGLDKNLTPGATALHRAAEKPPAHAAGRPV